MKLSSNITHASVRSETGSPFLGTAWTVQLLRGGLLCVVVLAIALSTWSVLLGLAAMFLQTLSAEAQTRLGNKKLIEFGWDIPDTAFLRRHIQRMETRPFDGVIFRINYTMQDDWNGSFGVAYGSLPSLLTARERVW